MTTTNQRMITTTLAYSINGNNNIVENFSIYANNNFVERDACSIARFEHKDFTQIPAVTATLITFYLLIMILAVFGNILVISTVWRNSHMQTVTNYYIVNLAISDFFVSCIVMPLKLLEYTSPYYAIVHPLSAMKVNSKSRTRKILAATWIIPIIICSPYLYCESFSFTIYSEMGEISRQTCNDRFDELDGNTGNFRKGYFIFLFVVMYFLPMVVIVTTCTKIARCLVKPITIDSDYHGTRDSKRRHEVSKRKVAKMVIVVAAAFIMSWSPFYIVSIVSQLQTNSFLRESNFLFTMLMTHLSGFINSCVNPFIYTVMSERFRKSFRRTLDVVFCSYYCRQRLLRYRESLSSRRPTAVTSFVEPEEEPLRNECYSRRIFAGRFKLHPRTSDSDSGSNKSFHSFRKSKRTETSRINCERESDFGKRVFITNENIKLEELGMTKPLQCNLVQSNNGSLKENDEYNLVLNETSRMINLITDKDCYRDS
ncbi:hypothetical protein KUTeg_014146, partial [Tegillarca granosa]